MRQSKFWSGHTRWKIRKTFQVVVRPAPSYIWRHIQNITVFFGFSARKRKLNFEMRADSLYLLPQLRHGRPNYATEYIMNQADSCFGPYTMKYGPPISLFETTWHHSRRPAVNARSFYALSRLNSTSGSLYSIIYIVFNTKMAMCWRLFISSMIILDVLCGIETVCVPAPFNAGLRGFPCLNQPMALAADTLGVQISTNLGIGADCGENKFELYNSNVGVINTDPGDIYEYDIYWDQPNTQCLVDLYYYNATGGKLLREFLNLLADQNGISNHPLDAVRYSLLFNDYI